MLKPFSQKLLSVFLICILGVIVYSDSFHCSFQYDDQVFIVRNPAITNIYDWGSIWHYFHTRFITFLSLAVNYHFSGLNVVGYHFFNLGVHLIASFLVWWLVLLTLSTPVLKGSKIVQHSSVIALWSGLIFVSHPVQTEAVTYIWQRTASMAAMFYLGSLCFYVRSRLLHADQSNHSLARSFYVGAIVLAVVAMFTKENSVTLPLMVLAYEFSFFKTEERIDWQYAAPFLLTILVVPITCLFLKEQTFQRMHGDLKETGVFITPIKYSLTQIRAMFTYIRLAFVPLNQNLDYEYPIFNNFFAWPVLMSLMGLIAIFYATWRIFSSNRLLSFFIFWFFLTLIIPESSFWAMGGVIFEHRLYLPLAGYSIFLVVALYSLVGKKSINTMAIILSVIVACNSVLTYERNKIWKNPYILWNDVVGKSPHKSKPYNNRANANMQEGRVALALPDYNKAIELEPDRGGFYSNRAYDYFQLKEYGKAWDDVHTAEKLGFVVDGAFINALKKMSK